MKKSIFLVVVLITIFFIGQVSAVYALDLNLVNSVRENEIQSAENLTIENTNVTPNTVSYTTNTTASNEVYDANTYYQGGYDAENENGNYESMLNTYTQTNTETTNSSYEYTTVTPTSTNPTTANGLTISDIINILVLVVGIVLILLGIAVLIRTKK